MSVEDSGGGGGGSDGVRPAIIDGLLCCILRAMSRSGASADLALEIERTTSESEVKASWVKLFTHFKDAMDTTRKKKIIDIDRETTKGRINDILTQLRNTDCGNIDSEFLLLPWNYVIKQFESEAEERSRIWEEEKSKDFDERLNNLESKMDKKHNELLSSIRNMLNEVDLGKKSGQVSFSTPVPAVTVTQPSHGHVSYPPTYAGVAAQQPMGYSPRGSGAHLSVSQGVPRQGGGRSRSPSIKRFRNEDGSTT